MVAFGNPGSPGRPPGSPHVLAEYIKKDVLDAWNEVLPSGQRRGPAALRELPAKEFIEAASRICPKELFMAVQAAEPSPFEHLTPDQKRELAAMLTAKVIDGEHLSRWYRSPRRAADKPKSNGENG
jgi:hypothetical protein